MLDINSFVVSLCGLNLAFWFPLDFLCCVVLHSQRAFMLCRYQKTLSFLVKSCMISISNLQLNFKSEFGYYQQLWWHILRQVWYNFNLYATQGTFSPQYFEVRVQGIKIAVSHVALYGRKGLLWPADPILPCPAWVLPHLQGFSFSVGQFPITTTGRIRTPAFLCLPLPNAWTTMGII